MIVATLKNSHVRRLPWRAVAMALEPGLVLGGGDLAQREGLAEHCGGGGRG